MTTLAKRPKGFVLEREQLVRRDLEELFAFFSDPTNLEELTPPWLGFRVLESSTPVITEGTTIDYALRVHGIPLRWRSLISMWNPPFEFVDEQVRGPYSYWHHHHSFVPTDDGVLVRDRVTYRVPGGAVMNALFIRRDLEKIFQYRQESLARALPDRISGN